MGNPIQMGYANLPLTFSKAYSSGTKSRIDLKLGWQFVFVRWLEVYENKIDTFGCSKS